MAAKLLQWMKRPTRDPSSYAARYPSVARFLEESFSPIENVEDLVTAIQTLIQDYENGTQEQRAQRSRVASAYGVLQNAVRDWFGEIQRGTALDSPAYRDFAANIVAPGDCIITFNYDVSLERELRRAGKFEIGDGYGFTMEGLPGETKTRVLKLHGSTSWLALLFGGSTGFSSFQPGSTLSRPVIGTNELSFLEYTDVVDPRFRSGGAALPVMIFPARSKDFYFDVNTGTEYVGFWDELWEEAKAALQSTSRVVICGYSLSEVDKRAREMLLNAPKKAAEIVVASGVPDTERIVKAYRDAGYTKVAAADEILFHNWVSNASQGVAAI